MFTVLWFSPCLVRRFPFDRLAGVEYESTVRVKKEIIKDETESSK